MLLHADNYLKTNHCYLLWTTLQDKPNQSNEIINILKEIKKYYEDYHKVTITPDIVEELTEEDVKNKNDLQLKKAIEILEEMTCVAQRNGY